MTQAQKLYNEYIICKVICQQCKKEVSFQSIVDWGYEINQFRCPYCKTLVQIHNSEVIDKIRRMSHLDKAIVGQLLEHAKEGQLHSHEFADATQWACLCLISRTFDLRSDPIPLSYIHRMFLIQLYRQLVEAEKMPEIDIYAIKAPIPVETIVPKVQTLTHRIQSAKKSRSKKKKKKKEDFTTMGIGPPKANKEKLDKLDKILGI